MGITPGEMHVLKILQSQSGYWKFFDVIDSTGESQPQIKRYDGDESKLAYPDFEKYQNDKIVLLVETKNYDGFFQDRENTLAMDYKQLREYYVVQRKEGAEIRIVFVVTFGHKHYYYWECLDNISNMECYYDMYQPSYRKQPRKFIYFNCQDFRTDIENLGLN